MSKVTVYTNNLPVATRVPINRQLVKTTPWPVANRPANISKPVPSRNYGTGLFRRYPDGTIDLNYAKGYVEDAKRKLEKGIPLQELEAVALSAVYPNVHFDGLPKSVVNIKGRLTSQEAESIRHLLKNC